MLFFKVYSNVQKCINFNLLNKIILSSIILINLIFVTGTLILKLDIQQLIIHFYLV